MDYVPGHHSIAYMYGWFADMLTGQEIYGGCTDIVYIFDDDTTYFEIEIHLN